MIKMMERMSNNFVVCIELNEVLAISFLLHFDLRINMLICKLDIKMLFFLFP